MERLNNDLDFEQFENRLRLMFSNSLEENIDYINSLIQRIIYHYKRLLEYDNIGLSPKEIYELQIKNEYYEKTEKNWIDIINLYCSKEDALQAVIERLNDYQNSQCTKLLVKINQLEAELQEHKRAENEGRILPEGYGCVRLTSMDTLAVFYPEGKKIIAEVMAYAELSDDERAAKEE